MFTIGLIDEKDVLKTYCYSDYNIALKEFKDWKKCFLNNNVVVSRTSITERNEIDEIDSIKIIFYLKNYDKVILFLSKSKNNIY